MIDSVLANVAGGSAILALVNTNTELAADGAQICTDKAGEGAGALAGFGQILQKMSEALGAQQPEAAAAEVVDAVKLPEAVNVPEAKAVEQAGVVKELPLQIKADDLPLPEEMPVEQVANQIQAPPVSLAIETKPPVEEQGVEVEPKHEEKPEKPENHEEKRREPDQVKCDAAMAPPPILGAPIATPDVKDASANEEVLSAVPETAGKRRAAAGEKVNLPDRPKVEQSETDRVAVKKVEAQTAAEQVVQQVQEDMPVVIADEATNDEPRRAGSPKLEFSLPQPHVGHKEIEQPEPKQVVAPEQAFVDANHPKIVTEIQGRLLPDGGTIHIRMDPPELGALTVQIDVRDGVVTASFQTSNDEATRLLSHSLGQLRQTLEAQGVSVEKLQVQQAPREHFTSNSNSREQERGPGQQAQERSARDDQQRRELLQRMWRRLAVGRDMLDLVA